MEPPPPPPPPHGSNSNPNGGRSGGLPDGKYDIFVIPPSSAGSGFLYLPSLQVQRNSFLAGVFCTAITYFIYSIAVPVVKDWFSNTMNGGGSGVLVLIVVVGIASWAFGKTQGEGTQGTPNSGSGSSSGGTFNTNAGPQPQSQPNGSAYTAPPPPGGGGGGGTPKSSWQRPQQTNTSGGASGAKSAWEKAREETRKREEEKRKAEELKKRREELEKERQKQREKDLLERLERERKEKKEIEERLAREREREKEKAKEKTTPKKPPMPSARTENDDDAYSFRPYDRPRKHNKASSAASMYSDTSYTPSQSTAKTTPPPSARGPYSTNDPDKIIIKGVYCFNNAFQRTPILQLISGTGQVTDGLILRITTEGLFIDDDVRGVPQREWDVKAWTMKLAESCEIGPVHVLRASIRDQEGKKYVFVLSKSEGWKVAVGLQRLRRGTQVRSLGVAGLPQNEAKVILESLGYI